MRRFARSLLARIAGFSLLWWVLAEGDLYRAWIGGLLVALVAPLSLRAWRPERTGFPWRALMAFLPYFFRHSLLAGVDVARRALTPRLSLNPSVCQFDLQLQGAAARAFLAWVVSLSPGTAGIGFEGDRLNVHVLDTVYLSEEGLRELETRVAPLFGERLPRA